MDVIDLTAAGKGVVEHPFITGLQASTDDVDAMVELLDTVKLQKDRLYQCEQTLRHVIANLATSPNKTVRIAGKRHRVKVVRPDPYWQQAELKSVWTDWSEAKTYLRIATLAPNMREVKKLETMSGNPDFERWKMKLLSARSESNSAPTVTIEGQ